MKTDDESSKDNTDDGNGHPQVTEDIQHSTTPEPSTNDENGGMVPTDDESPVVAGSIEVKPTHNVPPHLRSFPQSWKAIGNQRNMDMPRGPRLAYSYSMHRPGDPPELARMKAQLMKAREELETERQKYKSMHKSIAMEKQQEMDAALTSMVVDLLHKQAQTLAQKRKYQAKEVDLKHREQRIQQLELYLSEGQKILHSKYEEEAIPCLEADIKANLELQARTHMMNLENQFLLRFEALELKEAGQKMREQHYKALTRSELEAELREKIELEMQGKIAENAELEYNRGFGGGKEAGRKLASEEAYQKGFFEGYATCHKTQATLLEMRAGRIAHDSPELDFLYDATHPYNLVNCGRQMGGLGVSGGITVQASRAEVKMAVPEEPVRK